jgi:cation diffusion facilitator family transporter
MHEFDASSLAAMNREKHLVALSSVGAAVVLTATKLVVGVSTNSLGILSEAAHSGLDLVAAGVTFWAIRAASKPADAQHHYGHGKVENLAALFETALLLLTCGWIAIEAVERLAGSTTPEVDPSAWAFGVVILSIVVDISRSRALLRVARKYRSQALEADALHFSTDVWSSAVVLFGLLGVRFAAPLGMPWLLRADAVAALGVAIIVFVVSLRLAKRSIGDLLDAADPELVESVRTSVRVAGVEGVGAVRLRQSGPACFVDVTVFVDPTLTLAAAHGISDVVEQAVNDQVPGARVMVHVEPAARGSRAGGPRNEPPGEDTSGMR